MQSSWLGNGILNKMDNNMNVVKKKPRFNVNNERRIQDAFNVSWYRFNINNSLNNLKRKNFNVLLSTPNVMRGLFKRGLVKQVSFGVGRKKGELFQWINCQYYSLDLKMHTRYDNNLQK